MATILNDQDLKRLCGTVILDADESCIRPNSYILRLGPAGEFLNTGKEFEIGRKKKGIRIQPGHSVGVTAFETLDFRRESVHAIFADRDLHGILSPTTDLSREGIVAPTTQVDAGYHGTLNWTITNTSSDERRFTYKERIFRLTVFLLEDGERPEHVYAGDYQSQRGYVRSRRSGAPVGMKETDWEVAQVKGGPEDALDNLIKSGYPWHLLGSRLKEIDQQFKSVTEEYSDIHDAISTLTAQINGIRERQGETPETVRKVLRDEAGSLQNRWLIGAGSLLLGLAGIIMSIVSSPAVLDFVRRFGAGVGLVLVVVAAIVLVIISRRR